jgi:hypothetical protein
MKALLALGLAAGLLAAGCSDTGNQSVGIYVLVNVADNHHRQPSRGIDTARKTIDYLLQHLAPSDTLAAASIGTAGFNATDIIATETFSQRPSVVNAEKRAFRDRFDRYAKSADGSLFSDICGGMLQAIETLNRSEAAHKTILILSNLKEKPAIGIASDLPLQMNGYTVVVLKTQGLQPDSRDMKLYLRRVEYLRRKVEGASARFRIIEDLHQIKEVL